MLSPGTKLGPYEILEPIGAGGMGEVYRARDPRVGRDVAIKVSSEQFTDRFTREVHAVAALNHSNVCTLYDVGPNYLVMELVEGPTLADRIKQGPIPLEGSLEIAKQIADALEAAHEKGIVHRDLKPGNIKLRPDGTVKVLDFGLAKVEESVAISLETSPTLSVAQTAAGVLLGTVAYMSPEQARGKAVDKRADIWAFGVVLYEMLTGRQLFSGETVSDTLAAVLTREPEWKKLPAKTRHLLRRCLERDPRKRLRDIGEAMAWIESSPESAPVRHSWPAWSVVALCLLAVLALAPIALMHLREKPLVPVLPVRFQIPMPEKVSLTPSGVFALSPDGRQLAFYGVGPDGVSRIWIRPIGSLEARPLLGTEGSTNSPFFWSSDSRSVAFGTSDPSSLKKIDISGGPAQTICSVPGTVSGGSWNREGVIIFGTSAGGLMRVAAVGGVASELTRTDPSRRETYHAMPFFLPDGRHFLYKRNSGSPENTGIYAGSLDVKPEERSSRLLLATSVGAAYLASTSSERGHLLFVREKTLMMQPFDEQQLEPAGEPIPVAEPVGSFRDIGYFSASGSGVLVYRIGGSSSARQLTWVDRQGKALGRAGEPHIYNDVALSPDDMRAAVRTSDSQGENLWLHDFKTEILTRFTFEHVASSPVWSPDGNRIVFRSNRSGAFDLYQKLASGAGGEEVFLKSDQSKTATSFSRDGRFLVYTAADPKTKLDLWVLPLEGDRKPVPFLRTEFVEQSGQFSPDTRWIAYVSNESGRNEIYIRPFSPNSTGESLGSGAKWMVSKDGGTEPRWRGDSNELFYRATDGKVMSVEVTGKPIFQAGTAKPLFQLPSFLGGWDVALDGKRFLLAAFVEQSTPSPFTVVLNWQAGLEK